MKRLCLTLIAALALASGWHTAAAQATVAINATNFPDQNFRSYLLQQSYGQDGVLTEAELARVTYMAITGRNIASLKGIEFFTKLQELIVYGNALEGELNLSQNKELTKLLCDNNQLTGINLSALTELLELTCAKNDLAEIDLSHSQQLKKLDVSGNSLTSLNVRSCLALEELNCSSNQLTQITGLAYCGELKELRCNENQLTTLNLLRNPKLEGLYCYGNQIAGEGMDALIASIPAQALPGKALLLVDHELPNEGNTVSAAQVAALKERGWLARHHFVVEYTNWEATTGCTEAYELWIAGKQARNCVTYYGNGTGTVAYDHQAKTLTLKNASVTGKNEEPRDFHQYGRCIYSRIPGLTIAVEGTNTVAGDGNYGITLAAPTTITGDGTLNCLGFHALFLEEGDCTVGGKVRLNADGDRSGIIGRRTTSQGVHTYYATLIVQDDAEVRARGASSSSITQLKSLVLKDGLEITEPADAVWSPRAHAVTQSDNTTHVSEEWVTIERPATLTPKLTVTLRDNMRLVKDDKSSPTYRRFSDLLLALAACEELSLSVVNVSHLVYYDKNQQQLFSRLGDLTGDCTISLDKAVGPDNSIVHTLTAAERAKIKTRAEEANMAYQEDFYDTEGWENVQVLELRFETRNPYDLNGDETVDVSDVTTLVAAVLNENHSLDFDLNGDKAVDVSDVSALVSYILAK